MPDKNVSKHLINLEKQFAPGNPVLQQTSKVFQELDQLEFDLGLIDEEETNARKSTWWPIISTLGGYSSAKNEFINRYLGSHLYSSSHKFTVHQYTPQPNSATIPGTALDADHRLPFYQISREIEAAAKNEGARINAYIEMVTDNSNVLKNRLLIDTPVLGMLNEPTVATLLYNKVIDISDLVLVFTDLFDADSDVTSNTVAKIKAQQDSNKFLYVVDHSAISLEQDKIKEITASWRRRLASLGINTGQVVVLTDNNDAFTIDQRVKNLDNDRTYRILSSLENSIRNIDDVIFPQVTEAIEIWKDRAHMTILILLGFIVTMIIFAEMSIGILDLLLDPIIGPLFLVFLIAVLVPIHLLTSKLHSKFIIGDLILKQKKLHLMEDLAGMFEKSVTLWRMLLPLAEPVGKNKKTRKKIAALLEKCKGLVQNLNDQFSQYHQDPGETPYTFTENTEKNF